MRVPLGLLAGGRHVSAGAPAPWYELTYEQYANDAALQGDVIGLGGSTFTNEDVNVSQVHLETGLAAPGTGLTKCMRYDYVATGDASGGDDEITRNVPLPATVQEVWVESIERGTSGFTIAAWPGYTGEPAWKHFFGRVNPGPRFAFGTIGPGVWLNDWPPGGFDINITYGDTFDPGDATWHVLRFHWKGSTTQTSGDGASEVWLDGHYLACSRTGLGTVGTPMQQTDGSVVRTYGISMGRNFNNGPIQNQSWYWGRLRAWNVNPGW